jgi:hypothetical protein
VYGGGSSEIACSIAVSNAADAIGTYLFAMPKTHTYMHSYIYGFSSQYAYESVCALA